MMDSKVKQAYESLVPTDQLVINAMIIALVKKDKQISDMVKSLHQYLDKEEGV